MKQHLGELIEQAQGKKVLCVGDIMLDKFVYGVVDRISPESPVPVLCKTSVVEMPGGAGNVARNMAAMGLQVRLVGCVGEDSDGQSLSRLLAEDTRIDAHLAISSENATIVKTRYVANNQQLLRVDAEMLQPTIGLAEAVVCSAIKKASADCCLIIVSDYAKGTVTPLTFDACLQAGQQHDIPVLVDPKSRDFSVYTGAQLIKPNTAELAKATSLPAATDQDIEAALAEASHVVPGTDIIVTRAGKGMSWIEDGKVFHRRGEARQVFDVSGAGDTSMAAISLGLAGGGTLEDAVALAVTASGLAVAKTGTATVEAHELKGAIDPAHDHLRSPVLSHDAIARQVQTWKASGLKVGFTNGCFDILHSGHLKVLNEARARCDRLVVAINTDASVSRLKGPSRPINTEADRALLLSSMATVDAVTMFDHDTPEALIKMLLPDLLVKGGDYSANDVVGASVVSDNGGEVHIVDLVKDRSTTAIIKRSRG